MHRVLSWILALPLAWQAVTGYILYYRHDAAGNDRPWKSLMVKLHNGEFLGDAIYIVGLIYVILIVVFVLNGVMLLKNKVEPDH